MSLKMEPNRKIQVMLGINPNGRVQSYFTNLCYKTMDKYVPKDFGSLRTVVTVTRNSITYEMPYAHYQYKGMREDGTHRINPANYTTAGTGPYWDERMLSAEREKIERQVQNYASRGV